MIWGDYMPANTKDLKLANGKIAPQFFDEEIDDYTIAKGSDGVPYYRARGTIAMEAWTNLNPITTFPSNRYGFSIINDGTADLTFTIQGNTRTVKPGENYSALFEAFTSLTINATGAYRAEVLR
jgi:hypothetical protein